jgi:hypothetical protein
MAKLHVGSLEKSITPTKKKTSISGNTKMVKMSSMNKDKKRSYKKYKGQGR